MKQPDFNRPFELHVDGAATAGIGVVLCQRYEGDPYPLSYASRALTIHEQRYSVREIEALSIVWGIKKHRIYLEAGHFTVFTDHSSLQWLLNTSEDKQPRLWRWCLFLQSYDFEVKYISGKTNFVADQLSRNPVNVIEINNFNIQDNDWWKAQQEQDQQLQDLKEENNKSFQTRNGVLYKVNIKPRILNKNQVCKVVPAQLIEEVVKFYHDSTFAGHSGANKTKHRLLQAGYWFQDMDDKIAKYTRACITCQRIKGNRASHTQLSTTASDLPFKKVAVDYFGPLPKSENDFVHILVVIDMFSRYVELFPVTSLMPMELARTFYNQFILRHGVPEIVMLDNATTFTSEFNRQLAALCEMELQFTPAHHQASNGMVERFMATLRTMLLVYTRQESIVTKWDEHLRLLRFVYNNMFHASIQTSPFEVVHGRRARTPLVGNTEVQLPPLYRNTTTPQRNFAEHLLENLTSAFDAILEARKLHMKEDIKTYELEEKVMLFNNKISGKRSPRKLAMDWSGPWLVTEVLSETRYNLKNEETSKCLQNIHSYHMKPFFE